MTAAELDLRDLGLDEGGHLLLKAALQKLDVGARLHVYGTAPGLDAHLRAYCRAQGHAVEWPAVRPSPATVTPGPMAVVTRGSAQTGRWRGAERAGIADPGTPGAVWDHPPAHWGLAARGAFVEQGGVPFSFVLEDKDQVWADTVQRSYRQAAAAQWDPSTAIEWQTPFDLPAEVEAAVVQVMTYLIENETAALIVPARFSAQIHPHFREVMQLLAIQAADEARHVEVFTRRALLKGSELGLSTAGGQASLKTLVDEPDFALASFLLSVLGEGSFLVLLWFLRDHAPDPVTRAVARLAAQDEARHVAFGLAHLERHAQHDPTLLPRLAQAIQQRHDALRDTAGLNEEVFDALLLLSAGSWEPAAIRAGHARVMQLVRDMDESRRGHLERLGFEPDQAERLSALHTRNFM